MVDKLIAPNDAVGPLGDDEWLNRVIYDPEHVDENGNVAPAAFPTEDLRKRGVSVNRDFVIADVVEALVKLNMAALPEQRKSAMVGKLLTKNIRDARAIVPHLPVPKGQKAAPAPLMTATESPQPATPPMPANPAHADIRSLHGGESWLKKLRTEYLVPMCSKPVAVQEFIKGLSKPSPLAKKPG